MYMDQEGSTLASEILGELKASCRRWFIAFCVMVALEVATIAGFMWYISLSVDETVVSQEVDNGDSNRLIGIGDNYGGETNSDTQTESNAE